MLYCWFVGLEMDDVVWYYLMFMKNWVCLLEYVVLFELFDVVLCQVCKCYLLLDDYFSVDGMLIDVWVFYKSFQLCDDDDDDVFQSCEWDFYGEKWSNQIYSFRMDLDVELMCKNKGQELKLCYGVCYVIENCNYFVVKVKMVLVVSVMEREVLFDLLVEMKGEYFKILGGDKVFDMYDYVDVCWVMKFILYFVQNIECNGGFVIDECIICYFGYKISLCK